MRTPFLLVLFTVLYATHANAVEFKLPPGKPIATIDINAAWKPEAVTRGVQAQSEDGTVYLSVEGTADAGEMGKIIGRIRRDAQDSQGGVVPGSRAKTTSSNSTVSRRKNSFTLAGTRTAPSR